MRPQFRLLITLILLSGLSVAQECEACSGKGWVPCRSRDHAASVHCKTDLPHRCDVVWRTECCRGLKKIACEACNDVKVAKELHEQLKARRDWTRETGEVDKACGARFIHIETEHFTLRFSIPRWRVKSKKLKRVVAAHVFAERLEEVAQWFKETIGHLPEKRLSVFIMANRAEMVKTTRVFVESPYDKSYRDITPLGSNWFTWPSERKLEKDKDFHTHVAHSVVHLLAQDAVSDPPPPPGERYKLKGTRAAWFHVGLAHWYELEEFKTSDSYCMCKFSEKHPWRNPRTWKKKITKELRRGTSIKFKNAMKRQEHELDMRAHAYCWSYVDFLIQRHKKKLPEFFVALFSSDDPRPALEVLKMDERKLEEAWQRYVRRGFR